MAEQFLSDFSKPSINANVAQRVLANEVLYMLTQGVIETDGQGVTQRFSNDTSGAQIRIVVPQALNIGARELGSTLNGDNFDSSTKQMTTTSVGLDVLQVIDTQIDIPQVTQDMLPISMLETTMKTLGMEINTQLNALTVAGKLASTLPACQRGECDLHVINPASDSASTIRNTLVTANSALDNGDASHNLAYFPVDDRIFVVRASFRPLLVKEGVIIVGGSNYAQDIVRNGGVSQDATRDYSRSAIIGTFDGVPVASVSNLVWKEACGFLGLPVFALDEVLGYFSSGYANARAVAQAEQMKIIDCPRGNGVTLQPLVRMGFKSFYPAGNQVIVTNKFDNDALITKAGGVIADTDPNNAGTLLVRGKKSRSALEDGTDITTFSLAGTSGTISTTAKTVTVESVAKGSSKTLSIASTDGALIEVLNPGVIGSSSAIYGVGSVTYVFKTSDYHPATLRVRMTAEDGTVDVYTVTITYAS